MRPPLGGKHSCGPMRCPKDHINKRILQTLVSRILLSWNLRGRIQDTVVCLVFRADSVYHCAHLQPWHTSPWKSGQSISLFLSSSFCMGASYETGKPPLQPKAGQRPICCRTTYVSGAVWKVPFEEVTLGFLATDGPAE